MIEIEADASDRAPATRDMFAEMYVAAKLADAGWEIYFPRRDRGIDMVAVKMNGLSARVRPIQVKGLYPTATKTKKSAYGYVGQLTAWHEDMVLAIPFFSLADDRAPVHIAWINASEIRRHSRGWRCQPAAYDGVTARPRRDWAHVFDALGLARLDLSL